MKPPFKKSPSTFNQRLLFPSNIFDLLPDTHECYLYHDLFKQIDTTEVESHYSERGQHAYPPKLIIGILIYAYSRGVFSSREIEKRCNEDLSFMYIAQMNCPNFRVLSDFRKDHVNFFHVCFKQTVELAIALDLASLGHISLDGSKFKANSSKHKAMSYKSLKEKEQQLTEEIEALIKQANACDADEDKSYQDKTGYEIPDDLQFKQARLKKISEAKEALEAREKARHPDKAIPDKKQISFADHDANIMGKKGSEFTYNYNPQISVDSNNQIIVGQHVSQHGNDQQEVKPALEQVEATTGTLPDKMSLDNGYYSGDNLDALETSEIDAYVATSKGEKRSKHRLDESDRNLKKSDFDYDEADDSFTCPSGQILPLVKQNKDGSKRYQGKAEICHSCRYKPRCCQSKKGHARTIRGDDNEARRQQMNRKMETDKAKAVYKKRKVIVEPVFGQIKNSGFRGFSLRGKEKVAGEFSLVCSTHNLKKIVKKMIEGVIRPKNGRLIRTH